MSYNKFLDLNISLVNLNLMSHRKLNHAGIERRVSRCFHDLTSHVTSSPKSWHLITCTLDVTYSSMLPPLPPDSGRRYCWDRRNLVISYDIFSLYNLASDDGLKGGGPVIGGGILDWGSNFFQVSGMVTKSEWFFCNLFAITLICASTASLVGFNIYSLF